MQRHSPVAPLIRLPHQHVVRKGARAGATGRIRRAAGDGLLGQGFGLPLLFRRAFDMQLDRQLCCTDVACGVVRCGGRLQQAVGFLKHGERLRGLPKPAQHDPQLGEHLSAQHRLSDKPLARAHQRVLHHLCAGDLGGGLSGGGFRIVEHLEEKLARLDGTLFLYPLAGALLQQHGSKNRDGTCCQRTRPQTDAVAAAEQHQAMPAAAGVGGDRAVRQ